jgi:predicted MFS family arabinose efflux permease
MIEMGVDPSKFQSERKAASISSLKPALFLIGIGMGVLFGYLMHDWFGVPEVVAYTSVIILFGGFGLLLYYFVEGKKLQETNKK